MATEIKVPQIGESITEVQIGEWLKQTGDTVQKDENLVVLESEKASVEVPAPTSGTLGEILKNTGDFADIGSVIGTIEAGDAKPSGKAKTKTKSKAASKKSETPDQAEAPDQAASSTPAEPKTETEDSPRIMPAARRLLEENHLSADDIEPTGPGGRMLKEDVQRYLENQKARHREVKVPASDASDSGARQTEKVPMSLMRRTIARRLVEAQQSMALLTTFNEVDMTEVMSLRKTHQEAFQKRHGIKLGFMSFFIKAVIEGLKDCPALNAKVEDNHIVHHNYYDIGVAIGGGKGLVVPVLRNAERLSLAEIESAIAEFAGRAKDNKIRPDELQGGTFTISNGGVYGSLLSTPIVNPPQSGVLGMHGIQQRPIALDGQVVIRPMMYIALSYDHRIVDGREAVTFLRRVKDVVENPARMLLEV